MADLGQSVQPGSGESVGRSLAHASFMFTIGIPVWMIGNLIFGDPLLTSHDVALIMAISVGYFWGRRDALKDASPAGRSSQGCQR
jgi:hypothetical protein